MHPFNVKKTASELVRLGWLTGADLGWPKAAWACSLIGREAPLPPLAAAFRGDPANPHRLLALGYAIRTGHEAAASTFLAAGGPPQALVPLIFQKRLSSESQALASLLADLKTLQGWKIPARAIGPLLSGRVVDHFGEADIQAARQWARGNPLNIVAVARGLRLFGEAALTRVLSGRSESDRIRQMFRLVDRHRCSPELGLHLLEARISSDELACLDLGYYRTNPTDRTLRAWLEWRRKTPHAADLPIDQRIVGAERFIYGESDTFTPYRPPQQGRKSHHLGNWLVDTGLSYFPHIETRAPTDEIEKVYIWADPETVRATHPEDRFWVDQEPLAFASFRNQDVRSRAGRAKVLETIQRQSAYRLRDFQLQSFVSAAPLFALEGMTRHPVLDGVRLLFIPTAFDAIGEITFDEPKIGKIASDYGPWLPAIGCALYLDESSKDSTVAPRTLWRLSLA